MNTSHIQVPLLLTKLLLCSQQILLFAFCSVSGLSCFYRKWKLQRKNQSQQNFQCSRWPMDSSQQSTTNQHCVLGIICNALWVKQWIFPIWKQKQAVSYLGANWRVVHANQEPNLPAIWFEAIQLWLYLLFTHMASGQNVMCRISFNLRFQAKRCIHFFTAWFSHFLLLLARV